MRDTTEVSPISATARWAGRILSGIVILFLLFDATIKLIPITPVTDSMTELGYPATIGFARGLGVVALVCVILYAIFTRSRAPPFSVQS